MQHLARHHHIEPSLQRIQRCPIQDIRLHEPPLESVPIIEQLLPQRPKVHNVRAAQVSRRASRVKGEAPQVVADEAADVEDGGAGSREADEVRVVGRLRDGGEEEEAATRAGVCGEAPELVALAKAYVG